MTRRSLAGPIIKSLLFIVVTTVATAVLAASITQSGSLETREYKARFTDASGLREGDSVRIAGVKVGRVKDVGVADKRVALVTFTVDRDRTLPATSTAGIKYLNLVGARFVEIERGTGAPGALKPGSTIPEERTTPALDLTQLFNGFKPLFEALSPKDVNQLAGSLIEVLQGQGTNVETLLSTVASLTTTIASKDQVIGQVIDNLTSVVGTLNARGGRLGELVSTLQQLISGLAADRGPIGEAIGALDELAVTTAGLLEEGRAPLKRDIAELKRLSDVLNDESATVEQFLKRLPRKMDAIGRTASYGSWLNLYLCEAKVTGAVYQQYPGENWPPPTGLPVTEARCK